MKRTIKRNPPTKQDYDLILAADLHLRDDCPACREPDEYFPAQERKLKFIHDLTLDNHATLLVAGDIFDQWKPSPWLISLAIRYLPQGTVVVPGQHDLPGHNLGELAKTGLQTLQEAGAVIILSGGFRRVLAGPGAFRGAVYGYAYGEQAENTTNVNEGMKILLWHRLVCAGKQPWPDAGAETGPMLTKRLPGYDLIVTGDNHQQFVAGAWLINPGSMMRMASDQADHEPAVYGWRQEDKSITRIPLPFEPGVVKATKTRPEDKASRDERMEAYIVRAKKQYESKLSFEKNLEQHFATNKERPGVKTITWKAMQG